MDRTKTAPALQGPALITEGAGATTAKVSAPAKDAAPAKDSKAPAVAEFVRVYKPDGSRQCEKKPGILLDTMERELAGIIIQGRDKRKDGLMHIQVCGSPSGMINVFEIKATFLKQAEQRGFKRLED